MEQHACSQTANPNDEYQDFDLFEMGPEESSLNHVREQEFDEFEMVAQKMDDEDFDVFEMSIQENVEAKTEHPKNELMVAQKMDDEDFDLFEMSIQENVDVKTEHPKNKSHQSKITKDTEVKIKHHESTSSGTSVYETIKKIGSKSRQSEFETNLKLENSENSSTPLRRKSMLRFEKRLEEKVRIFLNAFANARSFREKLDQSGYEAKFLPEIVEFEEFFVKKLKSQPQAIQMRMGSQHDSTVIRAASSALAFLVFMKKVENEEFVENMKSFELAGKFEWMGRLEKEAKANVVLKFLEWYSNIDCSRTSTAKLVLCSFIEGRAKSKENSTLLTVIRGLLSFWTSIGVVQISSSRSPTEESKHIWNCLRTAMKMMSQMKGGAIRTEQCPLSVSDIVILMKEYQHSTICWNSFSLQSMLLVLVLSGSGLRVGSVRNYTNSHGRNRAEEGNLCEDSYEDDSEDSLEKSKDESAGMEEECEDFEFKNITSEDIIVYRLPCDEGKIRLEVELYIQSSKTTGNQFFGKQQLGFSYPMVNSKNEEDWNCNAAVALLMQCLICEIIEFQVLLEDPPLQKIKITKPQSEPVPLFKAGTNTRDLIFSEPLRNIGASVSLVARLFELPVALVTSRSLRQGYAKGILEGLMCRKSSQTVVNVDEIKQLLCSSSRWNSAQTRVYIRSITDKVIGSANSDVGSTANEWKMALLKCSPWARRFTCEYVTSENIEAVMEKHNEKSILRNMKFHDKERLIDMCNLMRWNEGEVFTPTDKEVEERKNSKLVLNIRQTLLSLQRFLQSTKTAFGLLKIPMIEGKKLICPVADCRSPVSNSMKESTLHWDQTHSRNYSTIRYICTLCQKGGDSNWKSFRAHIRKHHRVTCDPFNWIYEE